MLKLLDLDSSYFSDEPIVRVLDTDATSGFLKAAADSRVSSFAATIKPEPGKTYVHILAMGAGEFYGANRNADYFPEENLKAYHQTFETSPAHIFQHHINKNPEIAIGKVVYAIYNERMHRVEVVAWIDRERGASVVEKIDRGQFPATSMACHTPFDTCSICHNKARSRQEYCEHLKDQLGRILPDGRKVMAINDGPLKFFDMSIVFRPADVTSSVLQKLANHQKEAAFGSAESAIVHGLQEKAASMKKLSELIKEVEGSVVNSSSSLEGILAKAKDPADSVLDVLVRFDLHHVLHALAELGISPSVGFFAKLIGQRLTGTATPGIEHLVQGLLREDPTGLTVPASEGTLEKSAAFGTKETLRATLMPFVKQSSIFPSMVMDRATGPTPSMESLLFPMPTDAGPGGNVGYIGGSHQIDPRVSYRSVRDVHDQQQPGLLKTLFLIGGAAVAAKWLLSRLIESKIREHDAQRPVKIVLVKSAQEILATQQLVRASLLKGLRGL